MKTDSRFMAATNVTAPAGNHDRAHRAWYFFTSTSDVMYALRTTVSGLAALYAAMWLQLDVPRWAIWTVVIVSPPLRGNALRKSAARVIGTTIGCVVGVIAVALFAEEPIAYNLAFAAWLGACAYWATLKRGFVSYGASLAAFTSAIVAADVSSAPQDVFNTAIHRGSATLLGVMFALLASEAAALSDDVPGELAGRISSLLTDVLEWAVKLLEGPPGSNQAAGCEDAPFTRQILGLDELITNAMAERPALKWVKRWIRGLPTALLSLQSAVLSIGRGVRVGSLDRREVQHSRLALICVRDILKAGAETPSPALRAQTISRALMCDHLNEGQTKHPDDVAAAREKSTSATAPSAVKEIPLALRYVLIAIQAILSLKEPNPTPTKPYPAPMFVIRKTEAKLNFWRTLVGMLLAFVIWDVTAWPQGAEFLVNVAVALVIFVAMDDPVAANRANLYGTIIGGVVGLAFKYLLLTRSNDSAWPAIVLFPLVFVGVWAETKLWLASLGVFYVNALLVLIDPANPQRYDFASGLNTLVALVAAYAFVPMVLVAIGAPTGGPERIGELLGRMRKHLGTVQAGSASRDQRLAWETQMCDEIGNLQAATNGPAERAIAVDLLLAGRRAWESIDSSPTQALPIQS